MNFMQKTKINLYWSYEKNENFAIIFFLFVQFLQNRVVPGRVHLTSASDWFSKSPLIFPFLIGSQKFVRQFFRYQLVFGDLSGALGLESFITSYGVGGELRILSKSRPVYVGREIGSIEQSNCFREFARNSTHFWLVAGYSSRALGLESFSQVPQPTYRGKA